MPPRKAQPGENQPWSIQQMAANINATESSTPVHGCPRHVPTPSTRPCAGGYMDMYVGRTMMWKLSKCGHMTGEGLVARPLANVSAARRWLNSSWMSGSGTDMSGNSARRAARAVAATVSTARLFRRARRPRSRSAALNHVEPSPGQRHASMIASPRSATSTIQAGKDLSGRLGRLLRRFLRRPHGGPVDQTGERPQLSQDEAKPLADDDQEQADSYEHHKVQWIQGGPRSLDRVEEAQNHENGPGREQELYEHMVPRTLSGRTD